MGDEDTHSAEIVEFPSPQRSTVNEETPEDPATEAGEETPEDPPTEGVGIKCVECGARPYPGFASDAPDTRQEFDLLKIAGNWRCPQHRPGRRR
jgi:hypothetical protein